MPIVIETLDEFNGRHGDNAIQIGGRLVFADGAMCDGHGQQRSEPPADKWKKLEIQRWRTNEQMSRAETTFHATSGTYLLQAHNAARYHNIPPPSPDAVKHLKEIREHYNSYKKQLAEIDAKLAKSPAVKQRQKREQELARHSAAVRELGNKIALITLHGEPRPEPEAEPVKKVVVAGPIL